jgi:hypothetical protein
MKILLIIVLTFALLVLLCIAIVGAVQTIKKLKGNLPAWIFIMIILVFYGLWYYDFMDKLVG